MRTTDAQVRKLMDEMHRHGELGTAGLRAGLSPNTARKYLRAGRLPSELTGPRTWRTREDPFAADWAELRARLADVPELEATTLFEDLLRRKPDGYTPGQLRTLQRRVKQWRAQEGPPKRIFFPQVHRPGEAMQTDFTWASALGDHDRWRGIPPPALPPGAAVLELGVGDDLPVGVDGGVAARCAGGARPARARADVPPDGQLHGRDPRSTDGQAGLQRGVRGARAALRHDPAHDRGRREGAERGRRVPERGPEAAPRPAAAPAREPGVRDGRRSTRAGCTRASRPPTGSGRRGWRRSSR